MASLQLSTDCSCGNAARYITINSEGVCGICALSAPDAIRLADVPALLAFCRELFKRPSHQGMSATDWVTLRSIIGRKP